MKVHFIYALKDPCACPAKSLYIGKGVGSSLIAKILAREIRTGSVQRGGVQARTVWKIGRDDMTLNSETKMSSLDYWRFCRELTLGQAIYLIVGEDPSMEGDEQYAPLGYIAVRAALLSDIRKNLIPVDVPPNTRLDDVESVWEVARLKVEDIRKWLK